MVAATETSLQCLSSAEDFRSWKEASGNKNIRGLNPRGLGLWFARNEALALGLRWLGLSDSTTGQKARFALYWLVSLVLIAEGLRGDGPQFDRLCASAREAGAEIFGEVTTSLEGTLYSGCEI